MPSLRENLASMPKSVLETTKRRAPLATTLFVLSTLPACEPIVSQQLYIVSVNLKEVSNTPYADLEQGAQGFANQYNVNTGKILKLGESPVVMGSTGQTDFLVTSILNPDGTKNRLSLATYKDNNGKVQNDVLTSISDTTPDGIDYVAFYPLSKELTAKMLKGESIEIDISPGSKDIGLAFYGLTLKSGIKMADFQAQFKDATTPEKAREILVANLSTFFITNPNTGKSFIASINDDNMLDLLVGLLTGVQPALAASEPQATPPAPPVASPTATEPATATAEPPPTLTSTPTETLTTMPTVTSEVSHIKNGVRFTEPIEIAPGASVELGTVASTPDTPSLYDNHVEIGSRFTDQLWQSLRLSNFPQFKTNQELIDYLQKNNYITDIDIPYLLDTIDFDKPESFKVGWKTLEQVDLSKISVLIYDTSNWNQAPSFTQESKLLLGPDGGSVSISKDPLTDGLVITLFVLGKKEREDFNQYYFGLGGRNAYILPRNALGRLFKAMQIRHTVSGGQQYAWAAVTASGYGQYAGIFNSLSSSASQLLKGK